jgi:hypothetical protein
MSLKEHKKCDCRKARVLDDDDTKHQRLIIKYQTQGNRAQVLDDDDTKHQRSIIKYQTKDITRK